MKFIIAAALIVAATSLSPTSAESRSDEDESRMSSSVPASARSRRVSESEESKEPKSNFRLFRPLRSKSVIKAPVVETSNVVVVVGSSPIASEITAEEPIVDPSNGFGSGSDEIAKDFSDMYPTSPVVDEAITKTPSSVGPSTVAVDPVDDNLPFMDVYPGLADSPSTSTPWSTGREKQAKTTKCNVANEDLFSLIASYSMPYSMSLLFHGSKSGKRSKCSQVKQSKQSKCTKEVQSLSLSTMSGFMSDFMSHPSLDCSKSSKKSGLRAR